MFSKDSWVMRPRPISSWIARGLLIVVIGFWTWFSIASGVGEMGELGFMALVVHMIMPLGLIALLIVCWCWEFVGGMMLIAAAIYMTFFFGHLHRFQEVLLMLEIPVALMGALLIVNSRNGSGQPQSQT